MKQPDKKLVLESGQEFLGYGFGADTQAVCEIVFNTSMAGYQEILSNPACTNQIVVMTYPTIGNYGITDEDFESRTPSLGALIVGGYCDNPSNFLLMHAMGPNVAGVIGTAVAAGTFMAIFGI